MSLFALVLLCSPLAAQNVMIEPGDTGNRMKIRLAERGFKYFDPVIDIHTHLFPGNDWRLIEAMDQNNIQRTVMMSATLVELGKIPTDGSAALCTALHPERFRMFAHFDPRTAKEPGYGKKEAARLRGNLENGAAGVKLLWTPDLRPYAINDPRFAPVLEMLNEKGAVLMAHIGSSPVEMARQLVIDGKPPAKSEAELERLVREFNDREHPGFEEVMRKYPRIRFIAAHWLQRHYDLKGLDGYLSRHPNLFLDTSARLPQHLNRHPEEVPYAREFIEKWADRIVFAVDLKAGRGHYSERIEEHRKFFEGKGKFMISGRNGPEEPFPCLDLPIPVLRKIYYDNAVKLLGTKESRINLAHFRKQFEEELRAWEGASASNFKPGPQRPYSGLWPMESLRAQALAFFAAHEEMWRGR